MLLRDQNIPMGNRKMGGMAVQEALDGLTDQYNTPASDFASMV